MMALDSTLRKSAPAGRARNVAPMRLITQVKGEFARAYDQSTAVKVIDDRGNELMAVKSLDEAVPER